MGRRVARHRRVRAGPRRGRASRLALRGRREIAAPRSASNLHNKCNQPRRKPMAVSKLTISVGLVNVPVRIENLIGKGTKPSGNYVNSDSGQSIAVAASRGRSGGGGGGSQVVGYPRPNGTFYVPSDEDLVEITPEDDRMIHLDTFVPNDEVEPAYYEKTYTVKPEKGAE